MEKHFSQFNNFDKKNCRLTIESLSIKNCRQYLSTALSPKNTTQKVLFLAHITFITQKCVSFPFHNTQNFFKCKCMLERFFVCSTFFLEIVNNFYLLLQSITLKKL